LSTSHKKARLISGGVCVPEIAAALYSARRTRTLRREELIPFSAASDLKLRNH
jgi:hypothetical protein